MSATIKKFVWNGTALTTAAEVSTTNYLKLSGNAAANAPQALKDNALKISNIYNGQFFATEAEVARVVTIAVTASVGAEYKVTLTAEKGPSYSGGTSVNEIQNVFTHTAPTGATQNTIVAAFTAAINNHPFWSTRVTASGTTSLVLTAKTGFPIFGYSVYGPLAATLSTAGTAGVGIGNYLLLDPTMPTDTYYGAVTAGQTYHVFTFMYKVPSEAVMGQEISEKYVLYVNSNTNNGAVTGSYPNKTASTLALVSLFNAIVH